MKPKLRSDVTYYRLDGGTAFHRGGQWLRLSSTQIYDVLEQLSPRLNGARHLEDLLRGLAPRPADKIRRLIELLSKHNLVTDASAELPHSLSEALLETYQAEIAFLDAHFGSGAARFERFRQQRVLVIGDPSYTPAQAVAFAQLGVRNSQVYPPLPAPALAWTKDATRWLRERDPELVVENCENLWTAVREADLVIVAALSAPLHTFVDVTAQLLDHPAWVMPVIVAGNEAWLGPIAGPSQTWIRWWSQLDAQFTDWQDPERLPTSEFWSPQTASYLANVAAFEMMRWMCCSPDERPQPQALLVELETFKVEAVELSSLLPSDAPDSQQARQDRLEQLTALPPLTTDQFAQAAVTLIGERRHITAFGEQNLTQLPLHVIRAQLTGTGAQVYGCGLSGAEARLSCMRRAIEQLQQQRFKQASGPAWMADVVSGEVLDCRPVLAYAQVPVVTASGLTWVQAQERALLDLYLCSALDQGTLHFLRDDAEVVDAQCLRLLRILQLSEQAAELWSCPNDLNLPLKLVKIGGRAVGVALASTPELAQRESLLSALLYVQAKATGEEEYCPPTLHLNAPELTALESGALPRTHSFNPGADIGRRVAASFARRGQRCVTTPAFTNQPLLTVLPFVAHAAAVPVGTP